MSQAELQPPFPNLYKVKHVADNASKACVLCYKPTNTVLITANKKDWFYVCGIHLKDKNYAKLIYCDDSGVETESEWRAQCDKISKLQCQIKILEREEKVKEDSKNSWLNSLPSWSSKKEDKQEDQKEKESNEKDGVKKEIKNKEMLKLELKECEKGLLVFERENIKYRLEKVFYRGRLLKDYKQKKQIEIEKKLASGTLFPSLDGVSSLNR